MNKKEILQLVVAFIVVLGAIFGAINYFAKADDLELVDMRLEQKIVGDGIFNLMMQINQLEAKYGNAPCSTWNDSDDRQTYQRLKLQVERMKKKQDALIQRQTGGKN